MLVNLLGSIKAGGFCTAEYQLNHGVSHVYFKHKTGNQGDIITRGDI
jgi:hypothetical protein